MDFNIKIFIKNYIKEPILLPLKHIKEIFIGAFILLLCSTVGLVSITAFGFMNSTSQSIVLFLISLPFSVLIYGYVGLIIKNILEDKNYLPSWMDLKSIILIGVKINILLLLILFVIFIFYLLFERFSIIYAYWDVENILWVLYYPIGTIYFEATLLNNVYTFYPNIHLLILILTILITPLLTLNIINNGIKSILNIKLIKNIISFEYLKVLVVILLYFLISNTIYLIYTYTCLYNNLSSKLMYLFFPNFSIESFILEFIRKFLIFYFLVVIGETLGKYAKKHT